MASSFQDLQEKWLQAKQKAPKSEPAYSAPSSKPQTPPPKKKTAKAIPGAAKATLEQMKALEKFANSRSASASARLRKEGKRGEGKEDKPNKKKESASSPSPARSQAKRPEEKKGDQKEKSQTSALKHNQASSASFGNRKVLHLSPKPVTQVKRTEKPSFPKEPEKQSSKPLLRSSKNDKPAPRLTYRPIVRNQPKKLELPAHLPVSGKADEIREAIENNQVVIVCGETGSGKTTQLPKICLQLGRGQKKLIGHTQPRRIAAVSIAKRIAEETQTKTGEVAGYQIRFKDNIEPGASLKLMTDGILLAETQGDPLLKKYDTIILDEAHERSLNIDFLLGYLKEILPKRPDLKLIITSATIDASRFAEHFKSVNKKDVPVINVSGRLYPVEVLYRPILDDDDSEDRNLMTAIVEACEELLTNGPGDILVFLPGEREIREAADALSGLKYPGLEILQLFSRMTIEEQDRIFHSAGGRRIVLATNIAEPSLTVPGIRYVVDSGLARVKRYSYRNKVEQLQVEPISQAAAKQRAGRCGRTANGVCIRLYEEEDFNKRSEYTDPEILRSSLATVILRMKSLHLTEIQQFPFVDAPLPKAITDGYDLLIELNAVKSRGGDLTEIGKELARLPVDAKLARMLLAGAKNNGLAEGLVVAAALSVQDPRERPLEAQTQADQAHKKFATEKSDFASYLKMWEFMKKAIENKESNRKLEKQFRENFLSPRRLREWRDVVRQLSELVTELGWKINSKPATDEQVHRSLLAGLLGNLGKRNEEVDWRTPPFAGARGIKFWPWPGSSIAKKAGKWIMAAEIVETSRLYARTIADINPDWLETIGAHLLKKSWSEPHWEKATGQVVAYEGATLYGLPVYGQRKVSFAPKDPVLAREIFIRSALVEGDFSSPAAFWRHNSSLIKEIQEMEHKSRRPDVLVDDETIFRFYDRVLGKEVFSTATLDKWLAEQQKTNPKALYMTRNQLMLHEAAGITIEYFPKKLEVAGIPMAVDYNFDPGSPRDGVTLTVPLYALNQIKEEPMEWLVPGMMKEKAQALVKSLPQRLRRHFVPLPDWAKKFAHSHEIPSGALLDVIINQAKREFGIDIVKTDFKIEQLPPHLFMNYKVVDEHGRQLAMSRSIPQLRSELSSLARENFQAIASQDAKVAEELSEEITDWNFGDLPEIMEIRRKGLSLVGHPAVVDKGEYCSLEVFDDPMEAKERHYFGVRRLIRGRLKEQLKYLDKNLKELQKAQIIGASLSFSKKAFEDWTELKTEVVNAAIGQIALSENLPQTEGEFEEACLETKGKINLLALETARLISQIMETAATVNQKLNAFKSSKEVYEDINKQLLKLFFKGFPEKVPFSVLKHYPRYLKAILVRLERISKDPLRDIDRMREVQQLEIPYQRELAARRGVKDERLEEFGILLEELRVSLFAQELRTPFPVSVKRLNKIWQTLPKNHSN